MCVRGVAALQGKDTDIIQARQGGGALLLPRGEGQDEELYDSPALLLNLDSGRYCINILPDIQPCPRG